MMPESLTIGIIQFNPRWGDVEYNLAHTSDLLDSASKQNCDIVVLPEMWPTGMYGDLDFHKFKQPIPGHFTEFLSERARQFSLSIVAGMPERGSNNQLHNTSVMIGDDGAILAKHRKVQVYTDIVKLRRWCIRRHGAGASVSEICTATQVPRRTFYNWQQRYHEGGLERLLTDKPKIANAIHRTPEEVVAKVNQLRLETGWCPQKIAGHLTKQNMPISHMTVYRILREAGLNHPLTKPRIKRTYRRWQRTHPNSLWQCDLKLVPPRWLITILDDHSRFVPGSEHFDEGTAKNVLWLFDRAIHEYGEPRETLTDHGSVFWSVRRGESAFDRYCEQHGIKHILGGIGKPTTQGKIERWFRTYDLEHARFPLHRKFIHYYNWERPHMSLNYKTPAEVYFGDVPNAMR